MKYEKYKEVKRVDINPNEMPSDWYTTSYTISTKGGRGIIWERKEGGEIVYTISTDAEYKKEMEVRSSSYGKVLTLYFKRHYVLTQLGIDRLFALSTEQNL